jgi:hypothetical protein
MTVAVIRRKMGGNTHFQGSRETNAKALEDFSFRGLSVIVNILREHPALASSRSSPSIVSHPSFPLVGRPPMYVAHLKLYD